MVREILAATATRLNEQIHGDPTFVVSDEMFETMDGEGILWFAFETETPNDYWPGPDTELQKQDAELDIAETLDAREAAARRKPLGPRR